MVNMIEVTVKTLDSQNHLFSVSEELSVKQFKEEICPRVGIPVDQQRLIFRGRVLQDDKKITDYNVASNTVHLVQRPVQPPGSATNDEPQRQVSGQQDERLNFEGGTGGIIITAGAGPSDRNAIIMGTIGMPTLDLPVGDQGIPNASSGVPRRNSAAIRLQVGNDMLNRASNLLQRLEEEDSIASTTSTTTDESSPTSGGNADISTDGEAVTAMDIDGEDPNSFGRIISQVANVASRAALVAAIRQVQPESNVSQGPVNAVSIGGEDNNEINLTSEINTSGETTSSRHQRRPEAPRLREMAIAVQDLLAFNERLTPFLQYLQRTLRENRSFDDTGELESTQYVFDTVSSILHLLGHSYHAYSDLQCEFVTPPENRRLRASASILVEQSTVVRATIPLAVPTSVMSSGTPLSTVNSNVPTAASDAGSQPPNQSQINLQGSHPAFSINIQANAGIPDLSSLLGPAVGMGVGVPAGMMPFLTGLQANMQRSGAGIGVQGQPRSNTGAPNVINISQSLNGVSNATAGSQAPQPPPSNNPNTNTSNNTNSGNVAFGNLNLPPHLRNELMRPLFDMLLSCHSHHASRPRQRNRPAELHRHVNVGREESAISSSRTTDPSETQDFFESWADFFRCSSVLEALQPILRDVIQNYLLRGRDTKNINHIRTCARSMAKRSLPFLQSFTDKIPTKNETVVYQKTYSNLVTKFYTEILRLTLEAAPTVQYRNAVVRICEEFFTALFGVFGVCFPDNPCVPAIFAKAVVDEYFMGMSIVFRGYASVRLTEYFKWLSQSEAANETKAKSRIVYKKDESELSVDDGIAVETNCESNSVTQVQDPVGSHAEAGPSVRRPPVDSMDEDIDDILSVPRNVGLTNSSDQAFRQLPNDWVDIVRQDLRRQLGMPDQPPFSQGFCALFPRKH